MSRIRQIKPSWFLDKELRRGTSADAREFYIGLWMIADDEGYLVWDVERIGAELYPYDGVARRERNVESWAKSLETLNPETPHLRVYSCGHASVPKMKAHQRIAGNRTTTIRDRHRDACRDVRSRVEPLVATSSHGIGRVGNVGNGTSREATLPDGSLAQSEWQAKVDRAAALGVKS